MQAYATMGFCTSELLTVSACCDNPADICSYSLSICTAMKTAEITRHKAVVTGAEKPPSTWKLFADIYRREGLAGINKGVNAVAVRQCTNWGSRIGIARLAEQGIRKIRNKDGPNDKLTPIEKILASSVGGALGTWNQPIEVVRVEMQSMAKSSAANPNRPAKLTVFK